MHPEFTSYFVSENPHGRVTNILAAEKALT